jgi:outer membrane protein assembly factor BamB
MTTKRFAIAYSCGFVWILVVASLTPAQQTEDLSGAPALAAGIGRSYENWKQFRGPHGTNELPASVKLTETFDLNSEVAWKADIPGVGWSSPVIDGNRIWMTTAITETASGEEIKKKLEGVQVPEIKTVAKSVQLRAICVDAETGAILNDRLLADVRDPGIINPLNSYASPTPAIANGNVVCHFGSYGTWCLDSQTGAELWRREFVIEHSVGPGSSPVIFDNLVLLVCDGMDEQYVVCVDLETGAEVWKTDRPEFPKRTNPEMQKSFSTPLIVEINSQPQAIIPAAQWIAAYDPRTGKEFWRAHHGSGYSIAPMPTYHAGLIVFTTGYNIPEFVAVDPTGSGDVTETHVRWRSKNAPTMSSMIGRDGKVFAVTEKGILVCLEAKTGEIIARSRIGGNYSASPILSDGKLYLFSREGFCTILECTPEFTQVARMNLENPIMASPAVLGNDLILRSQNRLYRIRGRQPQSSRG